MKIEVYNTKNGFDLETTFEVEVGKIKEFKDFIYSLEWGEYGSVWYEAFAVDKEKGIDRKLDSTMLSRVLDSEEENRLFNSLLKAESNRAIVNFTKKYID